MTWCCGRQKTEDSHINLGSATSASCLHKAQSTPTILASCTSCTPCSGLSYFFFLLVSTLSSSKFYHSSLLKVFMKSTKVPEDTNIKTKTVIITAPPPILTFFLIPSISFYRLTMQISFRNQSSARVQIKTHRLTETFPSILTSSYSFFKLPQYLSPFSIAFLSFLVLETEYRILHFPGKC